MVVRIAVLLLVAAGAAIAGQSPYVIHKADTNEYHRPWCPVVREGKDVVALTAGQAIARKLKSHSACEKEPSAGIGTSGGDPADRRTSPPAAIYVDGSKYYHREGCSKRAGPLTRVALDDAAKTRWPCPVCRPPLRKKSDGPAVPKRGTRR